MAGTTASVGRGRRGGVGTLLAVGLLALGVGAVLGAPAPAPPEVRAFPWPVTEVREPCEDYDPLRRPLFGDLHVHTRYSQDAASQGTRTTPSQSYAFARGGELDITPEGIEGAVRRSARLERPLDFAAVTDHAEQLGEVEICQARGPDGSGSAVCRLFRSWPKAAFFVMNTKTSFVISPDRFRFCGRDGEGCLSAAEGPWDEIRRTAEEAYDRSGRCRFTTFVGYEWTGSHRSVNLHRNVIFRNDIVPDLPLSTYEAFTPQALWRGLREGCEEGLPGCEVLTIPHNSNLGGDRMFSTLSETGEPMDAAALRERAHFEPVVEMIQHKGASECVDSPLSPDEACHFEELPYHAFIGRFFPFAASGAEPKTAVRYALGEGLRLYELLQENPFRYGFIGSSDTHLGVAGATSDARFFGHGGAGKSELTGKPGLTDIAEYNPGGLAVVWAEENSRDAIFEALRRKEVYGTSGDRPVLRFFGGWELPEGLCGDADAVAHAYATGVPMGGTLPPRPDGAGAPRFFVRAEMDEGTASTPGTLLDRIQLVKGWVEDGAVREEVLDLAVADGPPGQVDLATCQPDGGGSPSLCASWQDPSFDPAHGAYYYIRLLESPTCRWTARQCLAQGVRCDEPGRVPKALKACCSEDLAPVVQERAWASPIWYDPQR